MTKGERVTSGPLPFQGIMASCCSEPSRSSQKTMIVSHRKKFIATKGKATTGTSVESFSERFCMPEGQWTASHDREEHVSESGLIGPRGAA